jgi:hypothetical protein
MPNVDAGAYFFSAVVPVCNVGIIEHRGVDGKPIRSSPIHMVRETLETLPTALQSHATEKIGIPSPFSRSLRTHFARFVILDQPYFNGRAHSDAIVDTLPVIGPDLLAPEPDDQLSCPYLLVMIDFDPNPDGKPEPHAYLEELWGVMEPELRAVFEYCYGFDAVSGATGFADWLISCQVETTMPFHDYWIDPPNLPSLSGLGLGAILLGFGLIPLLIEWLYHPWHWRMVALLVFLGLLVGVAVDYLLVMWRGGRPFPGNPRATLPHVLKGLYLQRAFADFVSDQQNRDPATWGAEFGKFLKTHRPGDLTGPTQRPGVIR